MPLPTFTTLGHGPLVLMLHGSGGGFRAFAPQVETLASLGWRAVAWDMPGYGYSPPIEPYAFKGLAERCSALIEALQPGGGGVILVGQGMGGMVAQEVAARRPDQVRALVLVATSAAVPAGEAYARHIADCLDWLAAGHDMEAIAELRLPRMVGPAALPEGVRLAAFCQGQARAATWRRALAAMRDFDRRAALAHLAVPTLLVAGAQDRLTPPPLLRDMAAAIAGSHYLELPGVGHLPHLEAPDAFDAALLDFLRAAPPVQRH
ncbi:MAG TPA: alpha/beta fold hydrolase [Ottowia sp.]|uniref:alpha/beta fold hydrolase n=1 Tax=Ottowia sp. TaxID=1898956 RepID=UPI002C1053D2|nr:alpha/beta fold hydrolase [Ottowia sp.]HMN20849.1 alpha/beta fold hydrolase [Ottowia sp.]